MPIFEYRCKECNETYEEFIRSKEEEPTSCKKCGGDLEKIISTTSFVLKGKGWAKDSYSPKPEPAKKDK